MGMVTGMGLHGDEGWDGDGDGDVDSWDGDGVDDVGEDGAVDGNGDSISSLYLLLKKKGTERY